MLRKTMIALFATASVGMLAPSVASARGGFGGGGGSGGGFHGGGGGGGFHGGGFGGGGFRSAAIGGGGFRSPAIGGGGFRSAAIGSGGFRRGAFAANGFRGGGFHHGFHHDGHRSAFGAFAVGLGYPYAYYGGYDYDYPDYAYDDSYSEHGGCYPGAIDGARDRRILSQRQVRARLIIIIHIRQQHMTEMPLAIHNNVVEALPSDRTDESLSKSVLPRGTWRRRSIANAH
jgi:hypothetical protein